MGKLPALFAALRHGSMLADPAGWKRRQNTINALVGLLGAIAVLLPAAGIRLEISNEDLVLLAGGIAAVLGLLVNPALTTATTDKIGIGGERKPGEPWPDLDVPPEHPPADRPGPAERPSDEYEDQLRDVFRGD